MNSGDPTKADAALAYVAALADAVNNGMVVRAVKSEICFRSTITSGQLFDVVQKALAADPEQRDRPAAILTLAAFSIAFPCSSKAP